MLRWFYSPLRGAQYQRFQSLILCAAIGLFLALNGSAEQQLLPAAFPFVKQWITVQTFAAHVGLSSVCNSPSILLSWNATIRSVSSSIDNFLKHCPSHHRYASHALWWIIHCIIHLSQKNQIAHLVALWFYIQFSCFFANSYRLLLSTPSYSYVNFNSPATSARYCWIILPLPFFLPTPLQIICYAVLSFLQDSSISFNLFFLLFFPQLLLCFGGIVTSLMKLMLLFLFSLFLKGLLHQCSACFGVFDDSVLCAKLCSPGAKDQVVERACHEGGKVTAVSQQGHFQRSDVLWEQLNSMGVGICTVEGLFSSAVPQFPHL